MKIGVIGTFIRDRIFPWKRPELNSIGGIFFTVSYLANLVDSQTRIYPVCNLGADFYDHVVAQLREYENISFEGFRCLERDNTQVNLHYTSPQERDEVTTEPMPPISFDQTELLRDADAIIINLITGSDLTLPALRQLRARTDALIYLDFHSHALGINGGGKRYYLRPDDWQQWIAEVDVLQVNEMEARTLAQLPLDSAPESLEPFGLQLLELRPQICHITLADKGSYLFHQWDGRRLAQHVPGVPVDDVQDVIGCGDAFEAAFVTRLLAGSDVLAATEFAHQVAAANCTFLGSTGIKEIGRQFGL